MLSISKEFFDYCSEKHIQFDMSATTNGYLLTQERCEALLQYNLFSYQITLDGYKELHDQMRIRTDGKPTWDTIYQNLLAIKQIHNENLDIAIRINYNYEILEKAEEILQQLNQDFFADDKRFHIYMMKIAPPPEQKLEFDCISNSMEEFTVEYLFHLFEKHHIDVNKYLANLNPAAAVCYARLNYSFVIDTDGTVRKCTEYLEDNVRNRIGTIQNGRFEIDQRVHAQWLYPNQRQMKEKGCCECTDFPICCGGVCPVHWFRERELPCTIYHQLKSKLLDIYFTQSKVGQGE